MVLSYLVLQDYFVLSNSYLDVGKYQVIWEIRSSRHAGSCEPLDMRLRGIEGRKGRFDMPFSKPTQDIPLERIKMIQLRHVNF